MRPHGLLVLAMVTVGCTSPTSSRQSEPVATGAVTERLDRVAAAVARWGSAEDLGTARAAAEEARNLILGPDVTGYGDADADGRVAGATDTGLLPGEQGQPGLLASPSACARVQADVLGGSWADPGGRWQEVRDRIDAWSPTGNTFPGLPSHPQRVVGWASLTLAADDVAQAREYAGHADLHVAVSVRAVGTCA